MSRTRFLLELECRIPRAWSYGDHPPPPKRYAVKMTLKGPKWIDPGEPETPYWKMLAAGIREELAARPEFIDNLAKMLVEKMEK